MTDDVLDRAALLRLADDWDETSLDPINTTAQSNARIGCAFELRVALGVPIDEARQRAGDAVLQAHAKRHDHYGAPSRD